MVCSADNCSPFGAVRALNGGEGGKSCRERAWRVNENAFEKASDSASLARSVLVYRINIRRAFLEPEDAGRRMDEVVKTASAKTRNMETRNPLQTLEFTARHIGCESTRN